MTTQEMIAVMQAHVDGKPIEGRKVGALRWNRAKAPAWNWLNYDYRIAPIAPGHNPKGLTVAQVGDGYRLLDEDEVDERWQGTPRHREIEAWFQRWDGSGWRGDTEEITYRTKLSREGLARLRNPVAPGHDPKGLTVAPGHNPNGLTVAQVGDGYRLLDEDEVDERWGNGPMHPEIEVFGPGESWDHSGWWGAFKPYTYRTKLSREELARMRSDRRNPRLRNPVAPGHNPNGLTVAQVGDGYRLLDEDEVGGRYSGGWGLREIECFVPDRTWDASGWWGDSKEHTFRTKLSREELARLRNPVAPGHNPEGLTVAQVGDGHRLLDEDEIGGRWEGGPKHREIEAWLPSVRWWDGSGWRGDAKEITYRTKLSREELARLREAKPEPRVTIPKSEYERLQQAAEVVAKLQALDLRPSPPPQPGPSDPASPTPTGQ